MGDHPIEGLMVTAMQSIKEMVDVNTIVGDAVQAPDGTVIIPISKVSFGFASGGGEYDSCHTQNNDSKDCRSSEHYSSQSPSKYPFLGGSGAGVSINPVAFMVVGQGKIRLLPVNINSSVDRILDLIPGLFDKMSDSDKKKIVIKNGDKKTSTNSTNCKVTMEEDSP